MALNSGIQTLLILYPENSTTRIAIIVCISPIYMFCPFAFLECHRKGALGKYESLWVWTGWKGHGSNQRPQPKLEKNRSYQQGKVGWNYPLQVDNYEIVINFFHISHNLTRYSAIVHRFTRIYPVFSSYEQTKQFG